MSIEDMHSHRTAHDMEKLVEDAFNAILPVAGGLFQARKCGILVNVPVGVRQQMLATHGDDAKQMLDLLDGHFSL